MDSFDPKIRIRDVNQKNLQKCFLIELKLPSSQELKDQYLIKEIIIYEVISLIALCYVSEILI